MTEPTLDPVASDGRPEPAPGHEADAHGVVPTMERDDGQAVRPLPGPIPQHGAEVGRGAEGLDDRIRRRDAFDPFHAAT